MPVYCVIVENIHDPSGIMIYRILEVIECNLEDFSLVNETILKQIRNGHESASVFYFEREIKNPFQKWEERLLDRH